MEINEIKDKKYTEIWLTRAEAGDEALRESLKPLYRAYKNIGWKVVVFESGTESLVENTKALFKHNIEVQARRECETADRSQQMCM